jgi:hypothetical protein
MSIFRKALAGSLLIWPLEVLAGNWGENWGSLLWGASGAPAQAIPVDSLWMLLATSLVVALIGAIKMRNK